ncbi:MAG: hypothetical protein Q8W44_13695 [Candidatus Palauibacterales bacterium]|nr:hypothetical protein [Candidatus Palauibacterales bacterium]
MTAVDTAPGQLRVSTGAMQFYRLAAHSGGEMAFRGREAAVGRMRPRAAGIENQVHLFVTERETVVVGLRVGHPEGGPNGPIRTSRYQVLREFQDLEGALRWLDASCPWTGALDDLKEKLGQEDR